MELQYDPEFWTSGIFRSVARFVPHNDVATSFRLVNRAAADALGDHLGIKLSQPVRPEAFKEHLVALGATRSMTLVQRKQLVRLVAASGSITNLEAAITASELVLDSALFNAAAAAGHKHVCKWFLKRRTPADFADASRVAAQHGHVGMCAWLLRQLGGATRARMLPSACEAAALHGHLRFTQQLRQQASLTRTAVPDTPPLVLLEGAAGALPLPALQDLHESLPVAPVSQNNGDDLARRSNIIASAAGSPTSDWRAKVEWLEGLGYPRDAAACARAAACPSGGALARLTWLTGRGYSLDLRAVDAVITRGDAVALELLLGQGEGTSLRQVATAARHAAQAAGLGHLAVLRALRARGLLSRESMRGEVLRAAVEAGRLHVAEWCLEELGRNDDGEVDLPDGLDCAAAASGSVAMLAWLQGLQQGPGVWSGAAFLAAMDGGCVAAVEWLAERGCTMPADGAPYIAVATNGDLAMLGCLRELGCAWGDGGAELVAGRRAPAAMLRCLRQARCTAPWLETLARNSLEGGLSRLLLSPALCSVPLLGMGLLGPRLVPMKLPLGAVVALLPAGSGLLLRLGTGLAAGLALPLPVLWLRLAIGLVAVVGLPLSCMWCVAGLALGLWWPLRRLVRAFRWSWTMLGLTLFLAGDLAAVARP